ncbi:hypothetical protein [Gloeothece verrucosa]|uniref:Uncharacterized protein n=1 Tax=Gloeothece verrucosa (strain PCC 7822) TaxID=497965 RepID=E0U980_GLOV7|nr:hypothetical protein [Gloeothece verrucosa]ADN17338.1 conserved hypothetical protein [Gloeothece verrucosa PCC 7822]
MISKNLASLLQRHPQLKNSIEEGQFLTGYTDGSTNGKTVSVFVFRSSWHHFCIQATACGSLPPGEVVVVTDNSLFNLTNEWKAYSLKDEKNHSKGATSATHNNHKSGSRLTSLAVEIAQKQYVNKN